MIFNELLVARKAMEIIMKDKTIEIILFIILPFLIFGYIGILLCSASEMNEWNHIFECGILGVLLVDLIKRTYSKNEKND